MTLTILGASGGVGAELTRQALARGEEVVAICRHPDRIPAALLRSKRVLSVPRQRGRGEDVAGVVAFL